MVLQREQAPAELGERDVDWADFVSSPAADAGADCVEVAATDPLYILYTSGTTGKPKGVVRDNGGHAVALRWSMENVYGVHPGETWFTASDVGWVVGHSYIVYAPLLTGCTTVLYEGKPVGTPDAGAFFRVISEYGAVAMFTAPTAYRAIKKEDAAGAKAAATTSRRCAPCSSPGSGWTPTPGSGRPTGSGSRSSTTGGRPRPAGRSPPTCAGLETLPIKPGSPSVPVPGYASARSSTRRGRRSTRASRGPSASGCRCRPARCRPCGATTTATSRRTCRRSTATT